MEHVSAKRKTVLVTGANGYIGNAVAKAFSRAGWKTYGLIRREEAALDLALNEIHPIIGTPEDLTFLVQTSDVVFDVIVSNTESWDNAAAHLAKVQVMLDKIAGHSAEAGVKPLVMFSSGCKDYGKMSEKHGDPALAPHTEQSPINPPEALKPRADFGTALLSASGTAYDAIVLRPTIVYGHSSSYYGALFDLAANSDSTLKIIGDPDAVMHSLHVDDCGDAYVKLAEHPNRDEVAGQAFNISNDKYETAREIADALGQSYGLKVEFETPKGELEMRSVHSLANFWQWVGSEKLRQVTGWTEKRASFVQGIEEYRLAYEATVKSRG